MVTFTTEVNQNEFLAEASSDVHAVVTVTAETGEAGGSAPVAAGGAAEVVIIDNSGSMGGKKIGDARDAACAAIDTLRDGIAFAVVVGDHQAHVVYPPNGAALVEASYSTREAAKRAVRQVTAAGGTAIGQWLTSTRRLMETRPDAVRHAILLTDGQNGENEPEFAAALGACEGVFQCDCRGIGSDWRVAELRRIATTLLGTVELLRGKEAMVEDFRSVIKQATSRGVPDVFLRVWTPKGATTRFLRQVSPEVVDLTAKGVDVKPLTREYPTGAWGAGTREYHLCVDVAPGPVGAEKLASRVSLVVGDTVLSQAMVRAVWTDNIDLSTRIDGRVAHYTGQAELARAIQKGLEAKQNGELDTAMTLLGRAAQLAAEADDEGTLRRLAKVVDVDDAATGKVRLKKYVDAEDEMDLDIASTKTVPAKR